MTSKMIFNKCATCGACDGRAGLLINGECLNCSKTRQNKAIFIDATLRRTEEEFNKTFAILDDMAGVAK